MKIIDMKANNPYQLIWYKKGWSPAKTRRNNALYWEWEAKKHQQSKNSNQK